MSSTDSKDTRAVLDFAVGLFIAGAILATGFIALRAANIAWGSVSEGYVITAHFDHIGSLGPRAPVKSAGVRVGRVQSIEFNDEDFIAEVSLFIDGQYQFPADSTFAIVSGNLLGGQYVSITPGGGEENLEHNGVVFGESAIVLEHLIGKFLLDKADE